MINDLKLGVKILKYGYGVKMSIVSSAFFFLIAACNIGISTMGNAVDQSHMLMGSMMLACAVLMLIQLIHSLNAVHMIQVSPQKKRMQTSVPAILSIGGMEVMYLLCAAAFALIGHLRSENMAAISNSLVMTALVMALLLIFTGIAYKYFLAASLIMFPVLIGGMYTNVGSETWLLSLLGQEDIPYAAALVVGLVLIVVGGLFQYLLSLAVYKAPMSKMAQMAPLRRQM